MWMFCLQPSTFLLGAQGISRRRLIGYHMSMSYPTNRLPFKMSNGLPGVALIQRVDLPDGRVLVVCMNEDEKNDAPVNMVIEGRFASVCRLHRLDPRTIVWVEYTRGKFKRPEGLRGGWEKVNFRGEPGQNPEWEPMTSADWEALGTTPPVDPFPFGNLDMPYDFHR